MKLVLPVTIEIGGTGGALDLVEGEARVRVGQLAGRAKYLLDGGAMSDGTPDRHLQTWMVRARAGSAITVTATHPRAGTATATVRLG